MSRSLSYCVDIRYVIRCKDILTYHTVASNSYREFSTHDYFDDGRLNLNDWWLAGKINLACADARKTVSTASYGITLPVTLWEQTSSKHLGNKHIRVSWMLK
jgi:hypothetical protein